MMGPTMVPTGGATGGGGSGTSSAVHAYFASGTSDPNCTGFDGTVPLVPASALTVESAPSQDTWTFATKVAAGGTICAVQHASDVAFSLPYIDIHIINPAGTQEVQAYNADTLAVPAANGDTFPATDIAIGGQVGSDITQDPDGTFKSTAGGVFIVTVVVQVGPYTP